MHSTLQHKHGDCQPVTTSGGASAPLPVPAAGHPRSTSLHFLPLSTGGAMRPAALDRDGGGLGESTQAADQQAKKDTQGQMSNIK